MASNATINHFLSDAAASVSGVAGLGASVVSDTVTGIGQAILGDFTEIGTLASPLAGIVTVDAERTVNINPYSNSLPMGIAIGGGALLGVAAGAALISVTGTVTATIGDDAAIYSASAISLNGSSTINATNMEIDGAAIGGFAVGFVIAHATFKPTVNTTVGKGAVVRGSSVSVTANNIANGSLLGVAAGGGILSGQGLDVEMEIDPDTTILIDQGADVTATDPVSGSVNITSTSNTTSDATGNAGNYGGIIVIIGGATSTLNNVNTVTIATNAVINAATTLTVLATSTNDAESSGNAGSDGVVPIIKATTTTNESDETHTTVETGARLTSGSDMSVEARTSTTGKSTPTASAGGLGVNTEADGNLTYGGSTVTEIQSSASLTSGNNLSVLARVTTLDLEVTSNATASALGADSTANGTIARPANTPTSDADVDVRSGSNLAADNDLTIKASHESVTSNAVATATTNGLGAQTDSTTNNDFDVATRVLTETNSTIHARALEVDADGTSSPTGFSDATSNGAVIDTGSSNSNQTIVYQRTINFNSGVLLAGPPSPEVDINSAGQITKAVGVGPITISGNNIIIPDIVNTSTAAGTATFNIPVWSQDPNPAGYGTTPGEDSIQGNATFTFLTAFDHVTINNASTMNLEIGLINPVAGNPNLASSFHVNVTDTTRFISTSVADPGSTVITIDNTTTVAPTDITLNDAILNSLGMVTISTADGNILAASNGSKSGRIESTTLDLSAPLGSIGTAAMPIATEATRIDANAADGIWISQTGDLEVGAISSTGDSVNLSASGSILDADTSVAINVSGPVLNLTAGTGSVGSTTDALRIDTTNIAGALNASAQTGINVLQVAGGLGIGNVTSTTGDITIANVDSATTGQDMVFGAGSFVNAAGGNVKITAADNFLMPSGARINASGNVDLLGDAGSADPGVLGLIDLEGTVTAAAVVVTGGTNRDTFVIHNVAANSPMTIETVSAAEYDSGWQQCHRLVRQYQWYADILEHRRRPDRNPGPADHQRDQRRSFERRARRHRRRGRR